MKVKTLILSTAAAVIMPAAGLTVPAMASSPGQIGGGDIYKIKNLTQNTKYSTQASANACDELEYSLTLHNPGYGQITNVITKATLPAGASTSNTSNATITYSDGIGSPVNASATVNLTTAQSISYENGTAKLFDGSGNVIKALPDGITSGGVNIGSLNGSTTEYVNFKAKVNCPTPPSCKTTPSLCPPSTPPKTPPSTPPAQTPPTTLVNTGPGDVIGIFSAVTIAGALGYRLYLSRRLARQ
jgi:hypothetical protein